MLEHVRILNQFKEDPYGVLNNDKDRAKLIAAMNKSIKLLLRQHSRKKDSENWRWE